MEPAASLIHDPTLPQLSLVLDAQVMTQEFARTLSVAGAAVEHCRIEHVRYKPGRGCVVGYCIGMRSAAGERGEQWISARLYEAGGSAARYLKAKRRRLEAPRYGPPVWHVPALDMVVWAFPNDRKLRAMAACIEPARIRAGLVPALVGAVHGADWQLDGCSHRVVHYVPEHGLSVRAELTLRRRSSGADKHWCLFGKTYYDRRGFDTYRLMQRLWASPVRRAGALNMPRPVLYQAAHRLLWQEAVPGVMLADCAGAEAYAQAGLQVAALHGAAIEVNGAIECSSLLERIDRAAATLAAVSSERARRLWRACGWLFERAAGVDFTPRAVLHGDLHAKNILIDRQSAALIDFDAATAGPPALDVASFLAGLLYANAGDIERSMGPMRAFLDAYRGAAAWRVERRDLEWCFVYALVAERVYRCVTRMKPGRLALIDRLIELAEQAAHGELDIGA